MLYGVGKRFKRSCKQFISLLVCTLMVTQLCWVDFSALAASLYYFKGYDVENITSSTFTYSGAHLDGTSIYMTDASQGEAVGFIALDESGHNISVPIDLGGLEIDFSTTAIVTEEGTGGSENDVPTAEIAFCGANYSNVISTVSLTKQNNTTSGSEELSSNVPIPAGTRSIILYLYGKNANTTSSNTVVFQNTSFIIHDASAPTCSVGYNSAWTNAPITVTVTAADSDSGLEGIYKNGIKVSTTSPYTFTVSANTSFSVYSKDYADKTSVTQNITVNNIDTSVPSAPASITLSHETWTNTNVSVTMPTLGTSSGAPERYIYKLGSGAWQDMPDYFTVSENGQYDISVAVADSAGNVSSSVSDTVYIDKLAPTIDNVSQAVSSGSCLVSVDVSDTGLSGIKDIKYAQGSHDAAYFATGGTNITDGSFTVAAGGDFTIYVSDVAGNYDIGVYTLNTAPSLVDIVDTNMKEDETLNVPVNVLDGETDLNELEITAVASDASLISGITINQSNSAISLDIIPKPNLYGGPVTITVEVTDAQGEKVSDTFQVTILSVNDPPVAVDDAGIATSEDASIKIDVLANDSDTIDHDTLTITDSGTPQHGTTSIIAGKIKYTPSADYNGADSFVYTISDGNGGAATATVYISAMEVNDAPKAAADIAQTSEDTSVLIDVLENDTDIDQTTTDDEVLSLLSAQNGLHGTVEIEDWQIRYTPAADWFGKDTFSYTMTDKDGLTSTSTVTVTVTGVEDAPWFENLNDSYTIKEDNIGATITFSIKDVETGANSLMLQAVSSDETLLKSENITIEGLGNSDDTVTLRLTPVANAYGVLTINLALGDGFTTVFKTFVLHITNVNDLPTAVTDAFYYNEDAASVLIKISDLISNDTDIDGDVLSFGDISVTTTVGTLTKIDADTYQYTPKTNYEGTDSFTYTVTDGNGGTATGTCHLVATPVNDAPTISIPQSSYSTDEDTQKSDITFSISDNETSAANLIIKAGSSDTDLISVDDISVVNNGDGTCTMTIDPMPDANGTATIQLTVSDGSLSNTDSFTLTINPTPDAPVAVNDSVYVPISGKQTFSVLLNDRDADGDALSVVSFDGSTLNGLLTFDAATQKFTYRAASGEIDIGTFTYTISDGDVSTPDSTATVTLDIHTIGHAPEVTDIANQYLAEDGSTGDIPFSVTDQDYGETINISVVSTNTALLPQDFENNIIVMDNFDGTYTIKLIPVADKSGTSIITVTAEDKMGMTDSTTFTLTVYPQNDAPNAENDTVTLNEDTSTTLNLLTNDSDPEEETIWINYIQTPAHGTISRSGSTYTYTPYGNYNGTETLTYRITDGESTDTATVTITVTPANDNPVAWNNWVEIPNTSGQSAKINVLGNDYDPDGDTVHLYQIVTPAQYGTAVINGDGTITYTRTSVSPNSNGVDSFVYRIIDRDTATGDYRYSDATVYIGVDFVSSLYCDTRYASCMEDASAFSISLPVSNPNSVDYELSIESSSLGTFTVIDETHVLFTPTANAYGYDTVTYTATQVGGGESHTGILAIWVYPVNDAPVIDSVPDTASCDEDSAGVSFDVDFHDVDCSDSDLIFYAYARNAHSDAPVVLTVDITIDRGTGTATVTAKPVADANGTVEIVVGVSDGLTQTEHVIDTTVNPVDDAPVISPVSQTLYEDTDVTFSVLTPNSDVDGDSLLVSIAENEGPAHGAAVINADGTITYTPNENYYGTDSLTFTVTDDTTDGLSSKQTVTFTVTPVNDQPIISNLNYYQTTKEDTPKDVTLTVTDVDNDLSAAACYTITSDNQTLIPNANITISQVSGYGMKIHLVPAANQYGTAIISIVASDGTLIAQAEFKLTVESVNDVPVAENDTANVNETVGSSAGTTSVTIDVTDNDKDVEDTSLQVTAISNVSVGAVTNNNNGTVTFSVDGNYNGTATFEYTVMDDNGASDTATVTVNIAPQNDPPKTANDSRTITEDHNVTINVLTNDTDAENDTLTLSSVSACSHGTAEINGSNILYTPTLNYYGTDSFTYEVSDGNGGTSTAHVYITITPVNDAPTLEKHSSNSGDWTMPEDSTAAFNFVVSDAETADANLIITIDSLNKTILKNSGIILSTSAEGYKIITVTPEENMNGTVSVRISVTDGALTTTKVFDIFISPINDAPILESSSIITAEDTSVSETLSATDLENNTLTFSKVTDPAHGTVSVNADGSYTYIPTADYFGSDSFDVQVEDGQSENNVSYATVFITVTPVNDKPVAEDDSDTTDEDIPITFDVLLNDKDADLGGSDTLELQSVGSASHGVTAIVDGKILYTPNENWNGEDSFTYTIKDSEGETDSAIVTVTVDPVNDTPSGGDDTAQTDEDIPVTIPVTENDDIDETTNADLENVTVFSVADPEYGTASISADGKSIVYTPDANWNGTETFSYIAQDAGELKTQFNVTVMVNPINDAPVIVETLPDVATNEDIATGAITFTVNDVEDEDATLTVSVTHNNSNLLPGITVTPDASGACSFTVTPKLNKNGTAEIIVTVTDSNGATDTDTFVITVNAVNDIPVAANDTETTNENTVKTIDVLANDDVDLDNEKDILTIVSVGTATFGSVVIKDNKLEYTPNASLTTKTVYTDTFTYVMKDASGAQSGASVTVTVNPDNDAPVISDVSNVSGIPEDSPTGTGAVSFTVTDEEDDDDTLAVAVACSNTTLFPLANITVLNPEGGTGSERTVQAIPAANKFGTATITLTVRDAEGKTSVDTFTVTVDSVNDVPVNGNDSYTVTEDIRTQLTVLNNDDVDYLTRPQDLTITEITDAPDHGMVEIAADGKTVYYTTDKDSNAADSFTYKIYDAYGNGYYTFTVAIAVTPVNDAPVITLTGGDSFSVNEGMARNNIPFTVTDVDNNIDTEVTLSASSTNPILVRNGIHIDEATGTNRTIDVQSYLKWNGTTTITIKATDDLGASSSQSFTFTVDSVNEVPVANDDTFTISEDTLTKVTVLANDTDGDLETNPDTEYIIVSSVEDNDPNAVITVAEDGSGVNIQPIANYNGPVTFTYITEDASGAPSNSATVTVTVEQVNDAPVADDESATTNEDIPVTVDVLAGDTDIDQDTLLNANPAAEILTISIDEADLIDPAHGSIAVVDGKLVYTPAANYNGTDTFEYNVDDGEALDKATVTVTVSQVNDNPVAVTDTASTNEDTPKTIDVLTNDTDIDTNTTLNQGALHSKADFTITGASVNAPANGSVAIVDGQLVYTPNANWFGSDVITYTISDGHGGTATGTVNVTVSSDNDLPVFATTPANMSLTEDGANGSENFSVSDVETAGANLTVSVVSSSNTGLIATSDVTITVGTDGARTVTVNPKDNQNGSSDIKLRVTDANGDVAEYTFTVTVTAVNDAPVGNDNSTTIKEDKSYTVAWTGLTSDVDIATNSDTIGVTIESGNGPSHGTAVVSGNNIIYTPSANWNGIDSFTYTVTDSKGATDTGIITVTVEQVNDAPVADDESATTNEDIPVTVDVLAGDTDIDQDTLLNADPAAEVLTISIDEADLIDPAHGSIAVVEGKIVYTPNANYNGTDTFEYNVDDGEALDKATVTVTITQVNDNPEAVTDTASTDDEIAVGINVLANDTDIDTDGTLNQDVTHSTSSFSVQSYGFVGTAHGTLSESAGVITYTPSLNFTGIQEIYYVLSDGHGGTATGTLNVQVDAENDAPVAANDSITTDEDTQVSYNVLANDQDQDIGDELSFVEFTENTSSLPGTLTATAAGLVTFTPDPNYHGSFTVEYQMRDKVGLTDTAIITITVAAVNDSPIAQNDAKETTEDTAKSIDVSGLISDADIATDSDSLTVSVRSENGPVHGTVSVNGMTIVYTPNENFNGTDSFTYTVTDSNNASDTGIITMTVTAVNDSPAASNDTAQTDEEQAVTVDVLKNDADVDTSTLLNATPQAALSISVVGAALHGSTAIVEGKIIYTPDVNYNGTDSFTYCASDGTLSSEATVSITISQINDTPVPVNDFAQTNDEELVIIEVLSNDTDIDTDDDLNNAEKHSTNTFTIASVEKPSNGSAVIKNNKIYYTPRDRFSGLETFTYTMSDGHGKTAVATISVNVLSVNDPPATPIVLKPIGGERYGGASTIHVTWSGFDIDGDALGYTLEYYDGAVWHVIQSGLSVTEYDFRIPNSLTSITNLQFRVKASDAEFTSGYGYSGKIEVDKDIPQNIVVTMTTADGKAYTAGKWTNQNVTVTAVSVEDASKVTFSYAFEDKVYTVASNKTVTSGVHTVYILATDEFGNASEFGGYLVRVDKLAPAAPDVTVSLSGTKAVLSFGFKSDPGGSGNSYIVMPDGSKVTAGSDITWTVGKNGEYSFKIYDNAANSTTFTAMVDVLDATAPQITCDSGSYQMGETSDQAITAVLSFTDSESEITANGYEISKSSSPSGIYKSYTGDLTVESDGTYYIHAYATNAYGLTTYKTFGPFIVKTGETTPGEVSGTVVVDAQAISQIVEGAVQIRLPGGEWTDSLSLENIEPGTYVIDVMDANGNITTMEITITDQQVAKGVWEPSGMEGWQIWAVSGAGVLLLALLLLFLLGRNVKVSICVVDKDGKEKVLRSVRKLKRRKDTVIVSINKKRISGSTFGKVILYKAFTKRMRGDLLVVKVGSVEVLRTRVPKDARGRFEEMIENWQGE